MSKRVASTLKPSEQRLDARSIRRGIANHLHYTVGKNPEELGERDWFMGIAHTIRDRLTERWMRTAQRYQQRDAKRVYYLSLEFLIGRSLTNSILNLDIAEPCRSLLKEFEAAEEAVIDMEPEAALGNGGLGRLAACFLDSLATLSLPEKATAFAMNTACFINIFTTVGNANSRTTGYATATRGNSRALRFYTLSNSAGE